MQKLTKEQEKWLIETVDKEVEGRVIAVSSNLNDASNIISQIRKFVTKAIEKCTEKEFPEFNIESTGNLIEITFNDSTNEHVIIEITDCRHPATAESVGLNFEKFKQFTENCNKIVEWLNDK
jgi:hypothetical protein